MNRRFLVGAFLAAVLAAHSTWVVYSQTAKPPGALKIERVKGDLYWSTTCSTAITPASWRS